MLFRRRRQVYNELAQPIPQLPENLQDTEQLTQHPELYEQMPDDFRSSLLFQRPALPVRGDTTLSNSTGDEELDKLIEIAGYAYDPIQDIFYSILNPWQRNVGYCRLYDEAAAPLGMIIDCEPIYFNYDNRKWMISYWKGQYDMVCGGEIGVYTSGIKLNIPDIFTGSFYNSVSDSELLQMSYVLKKNGKILFSRSDKHWWLTGFKLGEFAQPWELTMDIEITFPNREMLIAFLDGFRKAGYNDYEYSIVGNTFSFTFDTPRTTQPKTRTPQTDRIIQEKNKLLCEMYQEITRGGATVKEKLRILKEEAPELYEKALKIGSNKQFFQVFYVLIISAMYLLTAFSEGAPNDKKYLSRKKKDILKTLKRKIEALGIN